MVGGVNRSVIADTIITPTPTTIVKPFPSVTTILKRKINKSYRIRKNKIMEKNSKEYFLN